MSKIICDICGTSYPDTADQCPICGYTNSASAELDTEDILLEEVAQESRPKVKGGRFSKSNVRKRKQDPDFEDDDDEDEDDDYEDDDDEDDYDEDDEKPRKKGGILLNILLTIVILALLAVSGYIFMEYFLPHVLAPEETVPATDAIVQTDAPETEEPTVPCAELSMSESSIILTEEGQLYLLNVTVLPEDTTDVLTFVSANEAVVTVSEEGRVTAIGEGETVISIICGAKKLDINVLVDFPEATEEPTEAETEEPTEEPTEAPTEEPTEPLKDVELVVDKTDVTFRGYNLTYTFKLSNGLTNEEVTWTSENEKICTVDEHGTVTTTGKGTTHIIVRYGDQEVKIIVRCLW